MAAGTNKLSKTFVWIILGLLIVGLAGFGATNLSGTIRTIGSVGDQKISVDAYGRELQREIRAIEAQTRQPLQMDQVYALGLDQRVLSRLVALAALDNEVDTLGLSVGDETLQKEIISIAEFQGPDGSFDREAYRFMLSQSGVSEAEFEADLRAEAARTLVQQAVVSGVKMPAVMTDTITQYIAARRSFTMAELRAEDLDAPIGTPTDADLQAYYDAHPEAFTLPETKQLDYVLLTPEMILDQIDVDQDAVRQIYEDRSDQFNLPERRLVERLVFADQAAAANAMAQLEVGGTTFAILVQDRGLSLSDIDLGDVTPSDLGEAADAVFAGNVGDVVGPLPSSLGPALFRINGVLAARSTSFDEAEPELRDELAADRARRQIETQAQDIDDLLAGGATLEELAEETDLEFGTLAYSVGTQDGVAAYAGFREVADAVTDADFPAVSFLEDGSIFALQLTETLPPRPEPIEDARNRVVAGWTVAQTQAALRAKAEDLVDALTASGDFAASGLTPRTETGLTRTAYLDGTPADFMNQVFEMEPGDIRVIDGPGTVLVVRLDDMLDPEQTEELATLTASFGDQMDQGLSRALFEAFVQDAQLRARPRLDERALNAVRASFQ